MMHLVTGYAGYAHIQSEDIGAFNASILGPDKYVLEEGNQFKGSIIDNNTVRIIDGNGIMYGRFFRVEKNTYEDITILNGTAGKNRIDLICVTYEKNADDGTENTYLQVVRGEETEGEASIPEYTDGNILNGALFNQMPLYKVNISGVVLQSIEPMFVVIPPYKKLAETYILNLKNHSEDTENPHKVTAKHIGLDKVPNVSTNDQTPSYEMAEKLVELTSEEKLGVAFGKIAKAINSLISHMSNKDNPHAVTGAQIGTVDHFMSTDRNAPLSANKGRELYEMLGGLNLYVMSEKTFETTEEDTENGVYFLYEEDEVMSNEN